MKCPLPVIEVVVDSFPPEMGWRDCIKEECAWWDKRFSRCAILRLVKPLEEIVTAISMVRDKMPPAVKEYKIK